MLDEFKHLVDTSPAAENSRDKYGYPTTSTETLHGGILQPKTVDPIHDRIVDLLKSGDQANNLPSTVFKNLEKALVNRYLLWDETLTEYLPILKMISGSIIRHFDSVGIKPMSNVKDWQEAIALIKEMIIEKDYSFCNVELFRLRDDYTKYYDTAVAVRELMQKYKWHVTVNAEGKINVEKGIENTLQDIEHSIKKMGGLYVISHFFGLFEHNKLYNHNVGRYLISRNTSMMVMGIKPNIPFGYLLNVSIKYPYKRSRAEYDSNIVNVISLSVKLCTAFFQVQHYSTWERIFGGKANLSNLVREISIYDTIYDLPQSNLRQEIPLIKALFSFIDPLEFKLNAGFSIDSVLRLMNELDLRSEKTHEAIEFHKSTISKKVNIPKDEQKALFEALSHEPNKVNSGYHSPENYSEVTYWKKPLIKIDGNKYLLVNKNWNVKAFFEAIATIQREKVKEFDNNMGLSIEDHIKALCDKKKIKYASGKYKHQKNNGECDLIIETGKHILLFELKKKVLTGLAKSGSDISIIIDLLHSLLESQIQASRTELILKVADLDLDDTRDGKKYKVQLNGRTVERISLTQLDFRGFHDRIFLTTFLETLLTHSLSTYSSDKKILEKFELLKKKTEKLLEQYNDYLKHDPKHDHLPFMNSWFLNIDQVILLLELSEDADDFVRLFNSTKHIVTGTFNFYKDFCFINKLS